MEEFHNQNDLCFITFFMFELNIESIMRQKKEQNAKHLDTKEPLMFMIIIIYDNITIYII